MKYRVMDMQKKSMLPEVFADKFSALAYINRLCNKRFGSTRDANSFFQVYKEIDLE